MYEMKTKKSEIAKKTTEMKDSKPKQINKKTLNSKQ
jgi:hypothetical protein